MSSLGNKLRYLDNIEAEERKLFVENTRREHEIFWKKWYPFQCTELGDMDGNAFWHVVDLIDRDIDADGAQGQFAKFMKLPTETLVVDIASGERSAMLDVLLRNTGSLAGYVAVDSGKFPHALQDNFRRSRHDHLLEYISWDFWNDFPTEQVKELARKRNAKKIVTMTYWGATYLPKRELQNWVAKALTVSDAVYINMLTHGKFQPEVLKKHYMPLLTRLVLKGEISASIAFRALTAIKKMVHFGNEFAELMPLWTATELQAMLADISIINRAKTDLMWGQTAFVELLPMKQE